VHGARTSAAWKTHVCPHPCRSISKAYQMAATHPGRVGLVVVGLGAGAVAGPHIALGAIAALGFHHAGIAAGMCV
jgi:hypothetical protein